MDVEPSMDLSTRPVQHVQESPSRPSFHAIGPPHPWIFHPIRGFFSTLHPRVNRIDEYMQKSPWELLMSCVQDPRLRETGVASPVSLPTNFPIYLSIGHLTHISKSVFFSLGHCTCVLDHHNLTTELLTSKTLLN